MDSEGCAGKVKGAAGRRHEWSHAVQERLLFLHAFGTCTLFSLPCAPVHSPTYANPYNEYYIKTKISNNNAIIKKK